MKRYLILLLLMANLGLGVQSFAVMTKDERIKLEDQIDEAYEKEDKEKLLLLITKYVKEFPNNAEYLNRLGVLYDNKENYSEAEKWYSAAIEKGNLWAYESLAALYISMGDYKTADKWVRKGLEMAKKTNDTELQEELQETLDNIQELR